jgi:phosphatidylserine decarboxylase
MDGVAPQPAAAQYTPAPASRHHFRGPPAAVHAAVTFSGQPAGFDPDARVIVTDSRPTGTLSFAERMNFLVTNRIPRRALTRFMGWFSRIESPLLARAAIRVWRLFADDLRLFEAKHQSFTSLQACFTRELKPGARIVDTAADVLVSPCDAEVGAFGDVDGLTVFQAKGFPYTLDELVGDRRLAERYRDGRFVTLRLKSSMYHRFHAPMSGRTGDVLYISGDTWNVNPIALKRVERLFCRNERAVIELTNGFDVVLLVPVAAVLVASMRLAGVDVALNLGYRGPNRIPWDRSFGRGEEMGYFEHGSTIVMLTSRRFRFDDTLVTGRIIRMGNPLMRRAECLALSAPGTAGK